MSSLQPEQPGGARPPFSERLLPLLYRRLSFVYYRRSERYARYLARMGTDAVVPVPPIAEALAVYLSQRLPAWFVSHLGVGGLQRMGKLLALALAIGRFFARPALRLLRMVWRALKRVRAAGAARLLQRQEVVGASRASR